MKAQKAIIVSLILFSSIYIAGAGSQVLINSSEGKITGQVETQGRCMRVGVSDLKVACGKSLNNYEIEVTDRFGYFEFKDLTFEDSGTKYYVWILTGQRVIFPGIRTTILDKNIHEEDLYFFVFVWNIKNLFNLQWALQIQEL